MAEIIDDDEPTYRRKAVRRRRGAAQDPDADAATPAAEAAQATPAAASAAPAAKAPAAKAPAARAQLAQDRPAKAPPAQAAPAASDDDDIPERQVVDADALAAEVDALDPGELGRLLGMGGPVEPEAGDEVEGPVVRLTADTVFVDIGGKSEAWLPRAELGDEKVAVGKKLKARVLGTGAQGIRLTRNLSGQAAREGLEHAREAGIPVEGRVESRNDGGFKVALAGLSAFCPISHIDRHPESDLDAYIGRTMPFRILEIRGRDVVVSHRVIADEQAEAEAELLWDRLAEGDSADGVVVSLREFGVFVDIGGVTGLVHKSELGWNAEEEPPKQGDRVRVRVLKVDRDARRISLSLKDPGARPQRPSGGKQQARERAPRDTGSLGTFADLLGGLKIKG